MKLTRIVILDYNQLNIYANIENHKHTYNLLPCLAPLRCW